MRDVRERVLARLAAVDFDHPSPLTRDGYVYRMVAQHEAQHGETILQTLQLKGGDAYRPVSRSAAPSAPTASDVPREHGAVSRW